ncbi:hypothetical protein [Actinokineospora sp. NBRC 105648]|uniref:hypothetical protein n=1 Tax=Actinokineospora sp. NBRC 105648 TaxID=3032206 RepID=UPI00255343E5|nr:hypothetical protein [Actinokineospora sp. NBRC 105648]
MLSDEALSNWPGAPGAGAPASLRAAMSTEWNSSACAGPRAATSPGGTVTTTVEPRTCTSRLRGRSTAS